MPTRNPAQWQSGRKHSLGKLRRAHPASGATWNVQVVRGKMTSKCLWHACRALALGMVLMLLGAGMATVGYYANHLSIGHEIRGNATVRIRNESKGFHLNNLSYVGPIVMGFGGFIVVAACVMTFEARDSAAKVVPARFKTTGSSNKSNMRSNNGSATSNRRVNGITQKSSRWDQHVGVFRTSPAEKPSPTPLDRQALTAALIHFSKTIGNSPRLSPQQRRFSRSGSVPNLTSSPFRAHLSPFRKHLLLDYNFHTHRHLHHHHRHQPRSSRRLSKSRSSRIGSTLVHRESSNSLLHPTLLQLQRHALSVDESSPYSRTITDSPRDSLTSVIVTSGDGHEGRLRDRTKRSDTAKKHILARQKPIEKDEPNSPKSITDNERRRSSATSDTSYVSRQTMYRDRRTSSSRTPSIDSRSIQVELHSPEIDKISPRISRRFNSGQSSTPSVEREFRSQLSICSEPMAIRQLSGQSSLEPCVLEESPDFEEKESSSSPIENISSIITNTNTTTTNSTNTFQHPMNSTKKPRPDNLDLNSDNKNLKSNKINETKKFLQRSNSSRTFYRPKPKPLSEYDQIYLINSRTINNQEDFHDSLRVINERRSTILRTSESNSSDIELTNIPKYDSKISSAQVNITEKILDTKDSKIVTDIVSMNTERNVLQKTNNDDIIKKDFKESVEDELKKEQQNDNKAETEQPPINETIIVMEDN